MTAPLDANVLTALVVAEHVHHDATAELLARAKPHTGSWRLSTASRTCHG